MTLPPGRARLVTSPLETGSETEKKTMGRVLVACLAARAGVAIGEQFHRALEVGEENGHLLTLAFERALGGEDLLGEVLGGVGLRRCDPRGFSCCL